MVLYVLNRCLLIIPLLCLVLFSVFTLSKNFPYDPVLLSLESKGADIFSNDGNSIDSAAYTNEQVLLGLHLPEFYCSVVPADYQFRNNTWSSSCQPSLIPKVVWHGSDNQFHTWISRSLRLDFGVSMIDGKSAWSKTWTALMQTFKYVIPALILAFGLSIMIGLYLGEQKQSRLALFLERVLIAFNVTPVFWIATLAVIFLTTSQYTSLLNWFPRVDVTVGQGSIAYKQFFLPIIILVIHALAYLSIQLKNLYQAHAQAPFITSVKSRGIDKGSISRKHILPNTLIPLITIFSGVIPSSLGGSVVIEEIFNIPGLGRLLFRSILQGDWNVVIPTILLFTIITSVSYLLGDILYTIVNPKLNTAFK